MTEYFAVQAQGGVPAIGGGPLSARPPASQPGRLYVSNEGTIFRDTGASWSALSGDDAASILTKLKTVDANDPGLNATTLQGSAPGDFAAASHIGDGGTDAHPLATTSESGFTSRDYTAAEKTKLLGLAEGGGSPDASETVKGLVELATATELQNGVVGLLVPTAERLAAEITRRMTPEAWITPTLTNGWANFGSGFAGASFYKDQAGRVHVQGAVSGGATGTVVFTLPAGYRPEASLAFAGSRLSTATPATRIDVRANGEVFVAQGAGNETHITGISFRV